MQKVYLLVGCPGVGKSWLTNKLRYKFAPIEHDEYRGNDDSYIRALLKAADGRRPVLANTPFGISAIMAALEDAGAICIPVFVIDNPEIIKQRYFARDGHHIPQGHLTRQETYIKRANNLGAFKGTSEQVLLHLQRVE